MCSLTWRTQFESHLSGHSFKASWFNSIQKCFINPRRETDEVIGSNFSFSAEHPSSLRHTRLPWAHLSCMTCCITATQMIPSCTLSSWQMAPRSQHESHLVSLISLADTNLVYLFVSSTTGGQKKVIVELDVQTLLKECEQQFKCISTKRILERMNWCETRKTSTPSAEPSAFFQTLHTLMDNCMSSRSWDMLAFMFCMHSNRPPSH